ncbi:hypothetical protein RQP46_007080 [Phenoliferia psychrophenolica]
MTQSAESAHLPQLKLHPTKFGGPAPQPEKKFKMLETFRSQYTSYEWTKGYDVKPAPTSTDKQLTLQCTTSSCPYDVTAAHTFFKDLEQWGYAVLSSPFLPTHSHLPPYEPLSLSTENARRATGATTATVLSPVAVGNLLRALDPSLQQYIPQLRVAGLLVSEADIAYLDDEVLKGILKGIELPEAVRMEVRIAFERGRKGVGAAGSGSGEEEGKRRVIEWGRKVLLQGRN